MCVCVAVEHNEECVAKAMYNVCAVLCVCVYMQLSPLFLPTNASRRHSRNRYTAKQQQQQRRNEFPSMEHNWCSHADAFLHRHTMCTFTDTHTHTHVNCTYRHFAMLKNIERNRANRVPLSPCDVRQTRAPGNQIPAHHRISHSSYMISHTHTCAYAIAHENKHAPTNNRIQTQLCALLL